MHYLCGKTRKIFVLVEWSRDRDFNEIDGFKEILDPRQLECHIDGLEHGKQYYFHVACGNIRGYGSYRRSYPDSVTPSSKYIAKAWRLIFKIFN